MSTTDGGIEGARAAALITGASRGLGAALAAAAPAHLDLVLAARDGGALEAVAAPLRRPGREVRTVVADLSAAEGRDRLVDATEGRIDVLVNNAGLGSYGAFLDTDPERVVATLEVNAVAPVELTRRLLPSMLARATARGGRAGLINIASGFAFVPTPSLATYGATKALVLSLTEALAAELADAPVDVLAACPGPVKTGFGARAGFSGGSMPGAMSPDFVARATWAALGRQTTLVLGPLDTPLFAPAALARSVAAKAGWRALSLIERLRAGRLR